MASTAPAILVIEDEPQMQRFVRALLSNHGYQVFEATTGRDGLTQATSRNPEVVLLDLGLPDMDGIDVTRRLREWSARPIIVLSARGLEADKVGALDAGADDYLTKPFGAGELLARIRVALRNANRTSQELESSVLKAGDLEVDLGARLVTLAGREIHLTPTEYKLLTTLMRHAGKVLTQRHLLKEVWGPSQVNQPQYLRVYMAQLRQKIEAEPARPRYLITEPGVGYRFKAD